MDTARAAATAPTMDTPQPQTLSPFPGEGLIRKHAGLFTILIAVLTILLVVFIILTAVGWNKYEKTKSNFEAFDGREHATVAMGPGPAAAPGSPCPPGSTAIYSASGNQVICQSNGSLPEGPPVSCGANWAPEASAEANALEAAGGLPPSTAYYGMGPLQRHMGNNPLTGGGGLSDAQLARLAHTGGTP